MNKIVLVKSLFCPNQDYFKTTYDSISNNINYLLAFKINIDIILIGWIPVQFREKIEILMALLKKSINIKFVTWDKNYGKINLFYQFNNFFKDYDYLLYLDHDILFDIQKTKLQEILNQINNIFETNNFSIINFNQLEDCRHQSCLIDNIKEYNNIKIATSNINIDIGGGCFIMKKTIMNDPKYYHVYGFDEKYLNSCIDGKNGVLLDYYIVHPFDKNENANNYYKKWKINNILSKMESYENNSLEIYQKEIEESEYFWTKK